jgi:membrane protein required for colicin V production
LSKIDIVLGILLIIGAFAGYRKGFLTELFSLVAIFLGVLAGFKLMGNAMVLLSQHYNINEKVLPYVAFGVVFLVVIIVVSLIGNVLKASLDKTIFGNVDQLLGGVLGVIRTAFMISVLLWITDSLKISIPEHWTENSWLYPFTAKVAPTVTSWVNYVFPFFRGLFIDSE